MAKSCAHLTDNNYTAGGTTCNTASISPAANSAVIVAVFAFDTVTMSVSGAGLTWTTAINGVSAGNGGRIWVFVGAGASPSSGALTLTFDADAFVDWLIDNITGTVQISGASNSNVANATATSTAPAATLAAFANAANGTWAYCYAQDSTTPTAGTGFALSDSNVGSAMFGHSTFAEWRDSNDTSPDASLSDSAIWGFVALEIIDTAGSGGTVNTQTVSDTLLTTDAALTSTIRGRLVADSIVTADGVDLFYRRMRELLSNVVITEGSTDVLINTTVEATSEIQVTDDFLAWLRVTRLAQDNVTVIDELISSVIGYLIYAQILTSNVSVTDQLLSSSLFTRLLDSNVITTDQALRILNYTRDLLSTMTVTDQSMSAMQRFILLTDAISLEDSLSAIYIPETGPTVDNPIIRIGFDQPEVALGGYGLN